MAVTKLNSLVNPEVMADMVAATLPTKVKFSPLAKLDTTLVGRPGDTVTVPKYAYIGPAKDVAEGTPIDITQMTTSTTQVTIKKVGKALELTDESLLSGYGDPMGNAVNQLSLSIADKEDEDCLAAALTSSLIYDGSAAKIGYEGIVKADTVFGDENESTAKIMFISPAQEETIRLDPDFIDKNKSGMDLIMSGSIGKIAGIEIKISKKIKADAGVYKNPIIVVDINDPNEDPSADGFGNENSALTIYAKRDVNVESDRDIVNKTTVVSCDYHYGVALSNESKVVIAKFKA